MPEAIDSTAEYELWDEPAGYPSCHRVDPRRIGRLACPAAFVGLALGVLVLIKASVAAPPAALTALPTVSSGASVLEEHADADDVPPLLCYEFGARVTRTIEELPAGSEPHLPSPVTRRLEVSLGSDTLALLAPDSRLFGKFTDRFWLRDASGKLPPAHRHNATVANSHCAQLELENFFEETICTELPARAGPASLHLRPSESDSEVNSESWTGVGSTAGTASPVPHAELAPGSALAKLASFAFDRLQLGCAASNSLACRAIEAPAACCERGVRSGVRQVVAGMNYRLLVDVSGVDGGRRGGSRLALAIYSQPWTHTLEVSAAALTSPQYGSVLADGKPLPTPSRATVARRAARHGPRCRRFCWRRLGRRRGPSSTRRRARRRWPSLRRAAAASATS